LTHFFPDPYAALILQPYHYVLLIQNTMTQKQTYVNWLNTAYAMEIDIRKTLEGQLDDAKDYPKALLKQRS
jgi:hypothetical protein